MGVGISEGIGVTNRSVCQTFTLNAKDAFLQPRTSCFLPITESRSALFGQLLKKRFCLRGHNDIYVSGQAAFTCVATISCCKWQTYTIRHEETKQDGCSIFSNAAPLDFTIDHTQHGGGGVVNKVVYQCGGRTVMPRGGMKVGVLSTMITITTIHVGPLS